MGRGAKVRCKQFIGASACIAIVVLTGYCWYAYQDRSSQSDCRMSFDPASFFARCLLWLSQKQSLDVIRHCNVSLWRDIHTRRAHHLLLNVTQSSKGACALACDDNANMALLFQLMHARVKNQTPDSSCSQIQLLSRRNTTRSHRSLLLGMTSLSGLLVFVLLSWCAYRFIKKKKQHDNASTASLPVGHNCFMRDERAICEADPVRIEGESKTPKVNISQSGFFPPFFMPPSVMDAIMMKGSDGPDGSWSSYDSCVEDGRFVIDELLIESGETSRSSSSSAKRTMSAPLCFRY